METLLAQWCLREAAGCGTVEALLESYAGMLRAASLPVTRINVPVRTRHPPSRVASFVWSVDRGSAWRNLRRVTAFDAAWVAQYERSPFKRLYVDGERQIRRRLCDPACPRDFGILDELIAEGLTDYLVAADHMGDGLQGITWATNVPGGFTDAQVELLVASVPAVLLRLDLLVTRELVRTICTTYLGARTGPRVLAGEIHRGEVTTVDAVIGFCDLRGFTARSAGVSPVEVTEFLNRWFDRIEEACAPRGGEILKFIGDAALVLWPIGTEGDAAGACNAAIAAACDLTRNLAGEGDLRGGLALHRGEVAYGNIGAAERLDFTVIGTAVNIASRLEGLCGTLGQPWLVSEAVARHASAPLQARGEHRLKGVPEPVAVFGPVDGC